MNQIYILAILFTLTSVKMNAQNTENFESLTIGSTSFTNNGQSFTITTNSAPDTFQISTFPDAGWNGTSVDQRYIDNLASDSDADGTSFILSTVGGTDISIKSLYLFSADEDLLSPTNSTLTIEGIRDGTTVYLITKDSGFTDVTDDTINNGYTFIDFSNEGGVDNSNTGVDELVFTTTNDGDYLAIDAFTWDSATLSTDDFVINKDLQLFPNPATQFIQVSGSSKIENYSIYSVLGKEVSNGVFIENEEIDIHDLSNGLYFLKLGDDTTMKFIKE